MGTALPRLILAKSPYAWWKLDDASGDPQDSSGNGRHLTTTVSAPGYRERSLIPGWPIRAMRLNGGNGMGDWWSGLGTTFTIEMWLTPPASGTTLALAGALDSAARPCLQIDSSGTIIWFSSTAAASVSFAALASRAQTDHRPDTNAKPAHLIFTWDNGAKASQVWLDATYRGTQTSANALAGDLAFTLGSNNFGQTYTGWMASVVLYAGRIFTHKDVWDHYSAGRPTAPRLHRPSRLARAA